MKKSKISQIISILFLILFISGIGCFMFVPKLYDLWKEESVLSFHNQSIYYQLAFYACYILCLMIIYQLMNLFQQVYHGSPFHKKIVSALNNSAILFMMLFMIVIMKAIFIPTLLSFVCAFICFMC